MIFFSSASTLARASGMSRAIAGLLEPTEGVCAFAVRRGDAHDEVPPAVEARAVAVDGTGLGPDHAGGGVAHERPELGKESANLGGDVALFARPDFERLDGIGHAGAGDLLESVGLLRRERHGWSSLWVAGISGWWPALRRLNGPFALLDERLLELLDHGIELAEVGVHRDRALEVGERLLGLVEVEVDLPVAGERPPVLRVALDYLVAIAERLVVVADQEVDGGALVPSLRKLRLEPDDLGEG